ncbi:MAG: PIN domain-containing protein [Verrucomicrobia bacterium]|jgi:predicted nucleic acid-binding protein|nr:PIN domain-containing protein [Verrucomicrobiota bacterium]MBT7066412.1 PIN domain-containing protein [Verrucomicrobiota bacterium]MBT7701288.1 PIN domain-containing protein [Verrucomicrobiota bacterium]
MPAKVFLDANIIVYAHDRARPDRRAQSQAILFESLRNGTGVISSQVLSEFFVTITQKVKQPMSSAAAKKEIVLLSTLETVDIDATLVVEAVNIKERWQLSYWDALILAAAERAGCGTVYSEDMSDGQHYGSLVVCNPFTT